MCAKVHYLALGQDLPEPASVVVIHTADLLRAIECYGDRAYRYRHLDAGQLGECLNVGAVRLGLGSQCSSTFDDQVNDLLGIPEREAVVYLTTLGVPEEEEEEWAFEAHHFNSSQRGYQDFLVAPFCKCTG